MDRGKGVKTALLVVVLSAIALLTFASLVFAETTCPESERVCLQEVGESVCQNVTEVSQSCLLANEQRTVKCEEVVQTGQVMGSCLEAMNCTRTVARCDLQYTCRQWGCNEVSATGATEGSSVPAIEAPPPQQACEACMAGCEERPAGNGSCPVCVCPPRCNQNGARDTIDGTSVYCKGIFWVPQLGNVDPCQMHFECQSDYCENGLCKATPIDFHGPCSQAGLRDIVDSEPVYCTRQSWFSQKENNQTCQNSFECKSNFCGNEICYDIKTQVEENTSIINQILGWFRHIFRR